MTSDVVACSEGTCSNIDTFLCVKHCQRYVCFDHLQEHHRRYEQEKNGLPKELHRRIEQRFQIYNRLIDQHKLNEQERRDIEIACTEIRRTYEKRRFDYQQLQNEGKSILEQSSTMRDLKSYLEKLDAAIECEQQRERIYCQNNSPVNIKLEPNDYSEHQNSFVSNGENQSLGSWPDDEEDRSDQNLTDVDDADSDDGQCRKRSSSQNPSTSSSNLSKSVTIYRGPCPLKEVGLFGIVASHNIRLCEGKPSCLYNHLQSYHHMTARSAYRVCKAVLRQRDPLTTILFTIDDIIYNKHFHIACPFTEDTKNPFDCQPKMIQKAPCTSIISRLDMPRHLRDVHHVSRPAALKIVAEIRRCTKLAEKMPMSKLNRNLFDKNENIIVADVNDERRILPQFKAKEKRRK